MIRATIAIIAFAGALFATPWVPLVCAGMLAVRWCAWEVIVLGLFVDFLYLPVSGGVFGIPFPATIVALILVWGLEPIRKRLYVTVT